MRISDNSINVAWGRSFVGIFVVLCINVLWCFPAILCLAGLSSAVLFAWRWILKDSTWVQKIFSFFPNSWWFAVWFICWKNAAEWCFVWHSHFVWQYLVWPGYTSVADRKFFLSCWFLKTYRVCTLTLTLLSWLNLSFLYTWNLKCIFWKIICDNFQ